MTRKTRNLAVSLVFLVTVVGALAVMRLGRGGDEAEPPSPVPESVVLTEFSAEDLRSILVETDGVTLHFYSADGQEWFIADTSDYYRLDESKAGSAIRGFARIRSSLIVAEDADDERVAEFGLENPLATVTLKDREGGSAVLEIGAPSPSGSGRFGRLAGSGTVVVLPSFVAERAFTDADDYRDMSLPTVNMENMAGLAFRRKGVAFIAEPRVAEDPFVSYVSAFDVVSPFHGRYPLDDYELQKILGEEHPLPLAARAYLDGRDPMDPALGLDPEAADRLQLADSDGGSLSLIVGSSDGQGRRYALLGDREDAVFLLDDEDVAFLDTDPFRLIGKFVFLGSITDVSRVKVERGSDTWIMERTELGDPEDSKDDRFSVNGMDVSHKEFTTSYQKFISLMWEGRAENDTRLGAPDIRITVSHDDAGVENAVIRFWPYDDVYYQATVRDQPLEFLVGRYQVDDFIEDLAALSEYAS